MSPWLIVAFVVGSLINLAEHIGWTLTLLAVIAVLYALARLARALYPLPVVPPTQVQQPAAPAEPVQQPVAPVIPGVGPAIPAGVVVDDPALAERRPLQDVDRPLELRDRPWLVAERWPKLIEAFLGDLGFREAVDFPGEGADLVALTGSVGAVVLARSGERAVGVADLDALEAARRVVGVDRAIALTAGTFTDDALAWAEAHQVQYADGDALAEWFGRAKPVVETEQITHADLLARLDAVASQFKAGR